MKRAKSTSSQKMWRGYKKKKAQRERKKLKDVTFGLFGEIVVPTTHKYKVIKPHGTLKVGEIRGMFSNVDTWSLVRRGIIKKVS